MRVVDRGADYRGSLQTRITTAGTSIACQKLKILACYTVAKQQHAGRPAYRRGVCRGGSYEVISWSTRWRRQRILQELLPVYL